MGLTLRSPPLSDEECFAAIGAALDAGCNYFNGGEFYGTPEHNSITLLQRYFEQHPEDADKVVLNAKGALGPDQSPNGTKVNVATSIENILRLLGPVGRLAQFEAARKDVKVDYEQDTLATIESYVKSGRIGGIAMSEVNTSTIRSAAKRFDITAVELELSLFHTAPLTNGILEACGELGIPVLAASPLGRGILGGQLKSLDDLPKDDFKRHLPRYQQDNFYKNLQLVMEIESLAKKKGCTTAQIAINWLLSLSKRPGMPTIIPIPGSSKPHRIRENATIIGLRDEDLGELERIIESFVPAGDRYPSQHMKDVDL